MQIPFVGSSYQGRSNNIDASRCINLFPEISVDKDSKTVVALVGTPGTKTFAEFPYPHAIRSPEIRMMHTVIDRTFVVSGYYLYELYSNGSRSIVRGQFSTSSGRISSKDNGIASLGVGGNQLMMIAGGLGYIYNILTTEFTQITDINFPQNAQQVEYMDGYFIVTNDTMGFYVSELYDGLVWPGLARAAIISTPDLIQKPVNIHQQLFFIKQFVSEVWYNAGTPTSQGSPFARVQGAVIDYGAIAQESIVIGNNTVFFLANQRTADSGSFVGVVMVNGYSPQVISPPCINYKIQQLSRLDNATAYHYNDEGHSFYVLTFPSDDITFVYDSSTNMWHERSSGDTSLSSTHRHLGDLYTYNFGKHLISQYNDSKILHMSSNYYDDDGISITAIRTAPAIFDRKELANVRITKLTIDAETKVGIYGASGSDFKAKTANGTITASGVHNAGGNPYAINPNWYPQIYLSWSNDDTKTWSAEYPVPLGPNSQYDPSLVGEQLNPRCTWRRLGLSKKRIFQIRIPYAVKKVILGAYVNDGVYPQ